MERRRQEKRQAENGQAAAVVEDEPVPRDEDLVYADEATMTAKERAATRKFTKRDAYHLPDLENGFEGMGQPNDPRIMSVEELEEYARQFNSGEDINLYDFSKIDFNGDFFLSLPAVDRYNILNAARLRSRLRMGLSKEQLDKMFPDRMAFSRFQIERVRERNELTQRLMNLNGMNSDGTFDLDGGGRIAGEHGREYVLVKNEGVEGGWALGVVSTDKERGQRNKPIDVDALHQKAKEVEVDEESEEDFEDVPVEGLNRLPRLQNNVNDFRTQEIADQRRELYSSRKIQIPGTVRTVPDEPKSLFVEDELHDPILRDEYDDEEEENFKKAIALSLQPETVGIDGMDGTRLEKDNGSYSRLDGEDIEEDEHLNLAIALSLRKHHNEEVEEETFEYVPFPEYQQRAVQEAKPLPKTSGGMVAHIVNNRANAAVPKRRAESTSSDSDMDLEATLAAARKKKAPVAKSHSEAPAPKNVPNPFDGPLPFEKLDFKSSIFKRNGGNLGKDQPVQNDDDRQEEQAGGFEVEDKQEKAKPLPPWLISSEDIRSQIQEQQKFETEINAKDRERAQEDQRIFTRDHGIIEVASSDSDSDVEILDQIPAQKTTGDVNDGVNSSEVEAYKVDIVQEGRPPTSSPRASKSDKDAEEEELDDWSESDYGDATRPTDVVNPDRKALEEMTENAPRQESRSPSFEDIVIPDQTTARKSPAKSPSPVFEDVTISDGPLEQGNFSEVNMNPEITGEEFDLQQADIVNDVDFDDFSDPDDEELLAQLALEAEEHARFASTLNNKSERENQAAYEQELKALRNQQKKDRRDADEVSHIMITECQALLRYFGLPYITAPMEAEAQCAELVRLGLVDGIVTDDSDIFLFGGTKVYKNMFNSNKFVECYLTSDLERELSLSREQLISLAQLLGSDYTEGLPGIGPVTAVEILSEFPSSNGLEEFKEWWTSVQHSTRPKEAETSTFRRKFRKSQATKLFLPAGFPSPAVAEAYLKPDVDSSPEPFQWGVPDLDGLRNFLMATIGWSQERTDEVLVPVIRDMNRREMEGTQSNITRYFEGGVGTGTRRVLDGGQKGSTRMKEAVNKLKAKKSSAGHLNGTFADEAIDWVKKNDLSFTEREQQKSKKRSRTAKRAVRTIDEEHDESAQADNEDGSDEDVVEGAESGTTNGQPKRRRAKA